MKQETVEEGFTRINKEIDYQEFDFPSFGIGTQWQQERSYSEEEVILFCEWFAFELNHYGYPTNENILKALKQFKKK